MIKINKLLQVILTGVCCFSLVACGPSEEKVLQAQQKYVELTEKHNKVVEAHNAVSDNSYDEQLMELRAKIDEVEVYNLNDMEDEEIDLLIQIMDTLIASYNEFEAVLIDVKAKEDAEIIVTIPVTIENKTGKAISSLELYEQGNEKARINVLENLTPLESGQTLTGLMILRDAENTPWILNLKSAEVTDEKKAAKEDGAAELQAELKLPVEEYTESGKKLILAFDEEAQTIILTDPAEVSEEAVKEEEQPK